MPCRLAIAQEVKQDILDCDKAERRDLYDFLLRLQHKPLPGQRFEIEKNVYCAQLESGIYVSWEILSADSYPISPAKLDVLIVRVLRVDREPLRRK